MKVRIIYFCLLFLLACATTAEDPLKNTKKLIKEGHQDLYKNGAIKIPMTEVKLIAPGPEWTELAGSLFKVNARDAFLLNIKNAASTSKLIKAGVLKNLDLAKDIHYITGEVSSNINDEVNKASSFLISNSIKLPEKAWTESIEFTKELTNELRELADKVSKRSSILGEKWASSIYSDGKDLKNSWLKLAKEIRFELNWQGEEYKDSAIKTGLSNQIKLEQMADSVATDLKSASRKAFETIVKNSKSVDHAMVKMARDQYLFQQNLAEAIEKQLHDSGRESELQLFRAAKYLNEESQTNAKKTLEWGKNKFIQGYVSFPEKFESNLHETSKSIKEFGDSFEKANEVRSVLQNKLSLVWNNYKATAGEDIKETWDKAKQEIGENSTSIGFTYGAIKALASLTKLLMWDIIIKPIGNVSLQGVGFLTVNGVVYPSLLVASLGVSTSKVAVKIAVDMVENAYNLIAPTVQSALASVFSVAQFSGGKILALGTWSMAKPVNYGMKIIGTSTKYFEKSLAKSIEYIVYGLAKTQLGAGYTIGALVNASSYAHVPIAKGLLKTASVVAQAEAETRARIVDGTYDTLKHAITIPLITGAYLVKAESVVASPIVEYGTKAIGKSSSLAINYLAVPLASAGIPATTTSIGAATSIGGVTTGAVSYVAGKSAVASTLVFGNVISGGTAVAGSTIAIGTGAALSAYELGKALTVPSAYTLGSGMVMSYGMISHLGAHTILSVSDMAYLVLSLEGPRWVIYAIQGKLGKGENLAPGTVLDLEKMQEQGEIIKYVPVSDGVLEKIIQEN